MILTINKIDKCLTIGEEVYPDCTVDTDKDFTLYPSDLIKNGYSHYFTFSQAALSRLKSLVPARGIMVNVL